VDSFIRNLFKPIRLKEDSLGKWRVFKEGGRATVRRWHAGKFERLALVQYRHVRDSEGELKDFVHRLNAALRVPELVAFKHAFISPALLEEYLEHLLAQIPTESVARTQFQYLRDYALNFFIGRLNLANPLDWHRVHKTKWALYLTNDPDVPEAARTKRQIVFALNHFIEWLHERRPTEMPALKFVPLTRAMLRAIESRRIREGRARRPRPIPPETWKAILKRIDKRVHPVLQLCYYFGLRRSEAMGLRLEDVGEEWLFIDRQKGRRAGRDADLKGRESRRVPYWYATPEQAYRWIQALPKLHQDTVSDIWQDSLKGMPELKGYTIHCIRHTWITRAMAEKPAREVQLAAGHKDISVTMKYAHDHRPVNNKRWSPKAA
jgi:integrase